MGGCGRNALTDPVPGIILQRMMPTHLGSAETEHSNTSGERFLGTCGGPVAKVATCVDHGSNHCRRGRRQSKDGITILCRPSAGRRDRRREGARQVDHHITDRGAVSDGEWARRDRRSVHLRSLTYSQRWDITDYSGSRTVANLTAGIACGRRRSRLQPRLEDLRIVPRSQWGTEVSCLQITRFDVAVVSAYQSRLVGADDYRSDNGAPISASHRVFIPESVYVAVEDAAEFAARNTHV